MHIRCGASAGGLSAAVGAFQYLYGLERNHQPSTSSPEPDVARAGVELSTEEDVLASVHERLVDLGRKLVESEMPQTGVQQRIRQEQRRERDAGLDAGQERLGHAGLREDVKELSCMLTTTSSHAAVSS
jgi:hypothetical protein